MCVLRPAESGRRVNARKASSWRRRNCQRQQAPKKQADDSRSGRASHPAHSARTGTCRIETAAGDVRTRRLAPQLSWLHERGNFLACHQMFVRNRCTSWDHLVPQLGRILCRFMYDGGAGVFLCKNVCVRASRGSPWTSRHNHSSEVRSGRVLYVAE